MSEWRTGAACDREHGGDAGDNGDVERTERFRTVLDRLAHRGRHGEHAGIAARDDCRAPSRRRVAKRGFRARALLAIIRCMPRLAGARRNAIEIRAVAEERVGRGKRVLGLARDIALVARAEPDDGEMPAQFRPSQPGTRTTAK